MVVIDPHSTLLMTKMKKRQTFPSSCLASRQLKFFQLEDFSYMYNLDLKRCAHFYMYRVMYIFLKDNPRLVFSEEFGE